MGKGKKKKADEKVEVAELADEMVADGVHPLGGFSDALRVEKGFVLEDIDAASTPAFPGDKIAGKAALQSAEEELADLLERLWAESTAGSKRALLLVVQGMDTSGKGGIMRHVVSVNPEGVKATGFKAPTKEELSHDFLWRIEKALPQAGQLGVFDRSQYEDVLVVRVHDLVPEEVWSKRYAQINEFERRVIASGTKIVKVMTHISKDEQKTRLMERLERPDKYYKFNPGDVDERGYWDDYMEAYQVALTRTSTKAAPWYVVPANKKWYARYAVQQLLLNALTEMAPTWPVMDFDVAAELKRLDAS
jgi:PPK2 family polyphosphate:nucleotide phosphotransferase